MTDTIGYRVLYVSKCLEPSNEPGDFIDFSLDFGIFWFSIFEAPRNDRKFIHAWWGEQGIGDLDGDAFPTWKEKSKKILEEVRRLWQQDVEDSDAPAI